MFDLSSALACRVESIKLYYDIRNHHEICIQILSTNMSGIGLEVCKMCRILRTRFCMDGEKNDIDIVSIINLLR